MSSRHRDRGRVSARSASPHPLNSMAPLIVQLTSSSPWAVLAEAVLSFIRGRAAPTHAYLGDIIAEGRTMSGGAVDLAVPGIAIGVDRLGVESAGGTACRDVLDPRCEWKHNGQWSHGQVPAASKYLHWQITDVFGERRMTE